MKNGASGGGKHREENIIQIFFNRIKLDFQTELIFVRGDGWGAKEEAKPGMTP